MTVPSSPTTRRLRSPAWLFGVTFRLLVIGVYLLAIVLLCQQVGRLITDSLNAARVDPAVLLMLQNALVLVALYIAAHTAYRAGRTGWGAGRIIDAFTSGTVCVAAVASQGVYFGVHNNPAANGQALAVLLLGTVVAQAATIGLNFTVSLLRAVLRQPPVPAVRCAPFTGQVAGGRS